MFSILFTKQSQYCLNFNFKIIVTTCIKPNVDDQTTQSFFKIKVYDCVYKTNHETLSCLLTILYNTEPKGWEQGHFVCMSIRINNIMISFYVRIGIFDLIECLSSQFKCRFCLKNGNNYSVLNIYFLRNVILIWWTSHDYIRNYM